MQEAGSEMDVMMASIQREVAERTTASLRLKAGLLAYFCNNMRRRCHSEVQHRFAPLHIPMHAVGTPSFRRRPGADRFARCQWPQLGT